MKTSIFSSVQIIFFSLSIGLGSSFAQTFNLGRIQIDTIVSYDPDGEHNLHAGFINLTNTTLTMVYSLKSQIIPTNWIYSMCDPERCNTGAAAISGEAIASSVSGTQLFRVTIYPKSQGKIELEYEIYDKAVPSVKKIAKFSLSNESLGLSKSTITLVGIGNAQSINLTSNSNWTVSGVPTWLSINSITGTGNSVLTFRPIENPPAGSNVAVVTVTANSVSSKISLVFKTSSTTPIEDKLESDIKFGPNPIQNGQYLLFSTVSSIEIYNIVGEVVKSEKNTNSIYIEDLTSGVYLVKTNQNRVHKLIVK